MPQRADLTLTENRQRILLAVSFSLLAHALLLWMAMETLKGHPSLSRQRNLPFRYLIQTVIRGEVVTSTANSGSNSVRTQSERKVWPIQPPESLRPPKATPLSLKRQTSRPSATDITPRQPTDAPHEASAAESKAEPTLPSEAPQQSASPATGAAEPKVAKIEINARKPERSGRMRALDDDSLAEVAPVTPHALSLGIYKKIIEDTLDKQFNEALNRIPGGMPADLRCHLEIVWVKTFFYIKTKSCKTAEHDLLISNTLKTEKFPSPIDFGITPVAITMDLSGEKKNGVHFAQ